MSGEAPQAGQASFLLPAGGGPARFAGAERETGRLRAASLLKPLLFWVAADLEPFARDPPRWQRLARDAVQVSANAATVEAWEACGGPRLLDALEQRSGVRLALEQGGTRSFGRILVNADETARAYSSLAGSADPVAERVLRWMRGVPERQTFGVRGAMARALGVAESRVALKSGWYCDTDESRLRTHVVTLTETPAGVVGTAVLSAVPAGVELRRAYRGTYRLGDEVLPWHAEAAGEILRAASAAAGRAAVSLA